jgi:hypothetical protein
MAEEQVAEPEQKTEREPVAEPQQYPAPLPAEPARRPVPRIGLAAVPVDCFPAPVATPQEFVGSLPADSSCRSP